MGRELCRHCLILSPVLFGQPYITIYLSPLFLCWLMLTSAAASSFSHNMWTWSYSLYVKFEIKVTAPAVTYVVIILSNYIINHRHLFTKYSVHFQHSSDLHVHGCTVLCTCYWRGSLPASQMIGGTLAPYVPLSYVCVRHIPEAVCCCSMFTCSYMQCMCMQ